jgi:hypothetical protein
MHWYYILIVVGMVVAGGIMGWRRRRKSYVYPDGSTGTTAYKDSDGK